MTVTIHTATLDEPALWAALQARAAMPSQLHAYAASLVGPDRQPRLALVENTEGGFLSFVFHIRDWQGTKDICTLLSVSGSVARPPLTGLTEAWDAYARDQGWVAGYLQFAPGDPSTDLPGMTESNKVFLIDLASGDPLVRASQEIRQRVRRARAAGRLPVEDRDRLAEALVRLYPQTLARVGAHSAYDMAPQALAAVAHAPEMLVLGAAVGDQVEGVVVLPRSGPRAEYFINASSLPGRPLTAWLLAEAMARLAAEGVRELNLGGGVRPGDGLYGFKALFGAPARPLRVLRKVYRPDVYARLCAEAGVAADGAWFPAYRAPRRAAPAP